MLHLGVDIMLPVRDIVAIIGLRASGHEETALFLRHHAAAGQVIAVGDQPPKAVVIAQVNGQTRLYLTPISPGTLRRRCELGLRAGTLACWTRGTPTECAEAL